MHRSPLAATDRRNGTVRHYRFPLAKSDFKQDIIAGLSKMQKETPAKYFYDARGSALFEQICGLKEYYPTRTETAILERCLGQIVALAGPAARMIEYGSGASMKTRLLIGAMKPLLYLPIDISEAALLGASERLSQEFPWLNISSVCGDFTRPMQLPAPAASGRTIVFFPGSTIGNFTPMEALAFLRTAHSHMPREGLLLVGVDLEKDKAILDAAYNDAEGVTAAFNLNLLERINRELEADFDLSQYEHKAFYDRDRRRIEMHLSSLRPQRVAVAGRVFNFRTGESILTEISCKYAIGGFQHMARSAGFHPEAVWTDPAGYFSVHALVAM
jgi:dimethylhistidine N-methyltransferase